ncbi:MAG: preprotein translocase subunit SecE [Alphaproteobacteria bacterium]|jgi:preprotein translocase subunit SecE
MNTLTVKNFVDGVKTEAKKVSWPTRKEVVASSGIVLVLVLVASLFFVTIDWAMFALIRLILGI